MRRNDGRNQNHNKQNKAVFKDHIRDEKVIEEGLLSGEFFRGCLRVTPTNWRVAYVSCEGLSVDVCVDDEGLRNRAFHGDIVLLKLLPRSDWLPAPKKYPNKESGTSGDVHPHEETEDEALLQRELWQCRQELLVRRTVIPSNESRGEAGTIKDTIVAYCAQNSVRPRGEVIAIVDSKHKKLLVGQLIAKQLIRGERLPDSENFVVFKPKESIYPHVIIPRISLPEAYVNDPFKQQNYIYIADLVDKWPTTSKFPHGMNVRSIGEMGNIHDETKALLINLGISDVPHSEEMLEPLREMLAESNANQDEGSDENCTEIHEKSNWTIPDSEIAKRRDLRSYRIFTIDPYNAKDLDDALHITPLSDGTFEIG